MSTMRYKLGRLFQVVGMLLLPAAIVGTEMGHFGTRGEFVLLIVGVMVFLVGWWLQQAGKGA